MATKAKHSKRCIRCDFWVNEKTSSLPLIQKAVFIWAATAGHFTCIHRASERAIRNAIDRGLAMKQIRAAMEALVDRGLIEWDEDEEIVWLREGLDEQISQENSSPKVRASATEYLTKFPICGVTASFANRYPGWAPPSFRNVDIASGQLRLLPSDTVSDTVPDTVPDIQNQNQYQIQNQRQGVQGDPEPAEADSSPPRKRASAARRVSRFPRKKRAREIFQRYEQARAEKLGGNIRQFTDDDYVEMQRTVAHVEQEQGCDEPEAWEHLDRFGRHALDEAERATQSGDPRAESLRKWRAGSKAWSKSRYRAVMASVEARPVNGTSHKVKYDDQMQYHYFLDEWKNRVRCDEEGKRI